VHLFGLTGVRKELERGMEPEQIVDETLPAVVEFRQRARRFLLY